MPDLALSTFAWVRELASGDVLAAAAADPARTAIGASEEDALFELQAFLSEQLPREGPEAIARHVLPAGAHLRSVRVPLELGLPRGTAPETPVELSCLVLPVVEPPPRAGERPRAKDEAWVIILPLRHTLYVKQGEELEALVRAEAARMIAARAPAGLELLELLPAEDEWLAELTVPIALGGDGPAGRAASLRKAIARHEQAKAAVKVLDSVGRPLHARWREGSERRPFVGRERERALLAGLLGGSERLSCLLVGEARVGKTALLRAWWEARDAEARAPLDRPHLVWATSGAELVAGMSGLGQWQERVRRVMEAVEVLDALLYLDDLGDLFAEHGPSPVDLAGAIKPWVEDGRIRLVAELHPERLDFVEARNPSFFAALTRVRVEPPSAAEALAVLEAHVAWDGRESGRTLEPDALAPLVDLAARYLPYQAFPGKAVGLYRELVLARALSRRVEPVSKNDVYEAVSLRTGVPAFLLRPDRALLAGDLERELGRKVVGQPGAVRAIAETLCVVKAGLQPPDKPLATFLFVGPTGVGKTELARALASLLFGSETRLVRLDMSEYTDPSAAARLFRGPNGEDGLLVRRVREQPFSVILLDEIEKAHGSVHDLLLQLAGEGRLADARGRTTTFRETILILTSNVGARERGRAIGLGERGDAERDRWARAVEATFRPELVNRLDRVVVFSPLGPDEARRVLDLALDRVRARRGLVDLGVELTVTPAASEALVRGGFSPEHGARSLRRHVEDHVAVPLGELLAGAGDAAARGRAVVSAAHELVEDVPSHHLVGTVTRGEVRVRLDRPRAARAARDAGEIAFVGGARLELARLRELAPIVALREQARLLRVGLHEATAAAEKRRRRRRGEPAQAGAADLARLASEHARLARHVTRLDQAYVDAVEFEELAIASLVSGEGLGDATAEVRRVAAEFRAALAPALVALEPRRDAAALLIHELDAHRAFDLWLLPLLREAKRLDWRVVAHLPHERGEDWPPQRAFGPPRPPEALLERLTSKRPGERPRSVLLRVTGPNAGVWLALEGGVHRFSRVPPDGVEARLVVVLLALRTELTEAEWTRPIVTPVTPTAAEIWRRGRPVRELDVTAKRLRLLDDVELELAGPSYWPELERVAAEHLIRCEVEGGPERASFFVEAVLDPRAGAEALDEDEEGA